MANSKPLETSLYGPVRDFLVAQGFEVRGEVKRCDLVGSKGDELVVVELKLRFSVELLAQATDRLRITDSVYVAIPKSVYDGRSKKWRGRLKLLRRLEVGLLVVATEGDVQAVLHPAPHERRRSKVRQRSVLRELKGRSGDRNVGGSVRTPLVSAYREQAIYIACALEMFDAQSPAQLRARGACEKSGAILYRDYYGWFDRIDRGLYRISDLGTRELAGFESLRLECRARLKGARAKSSEG
jgi:hypothetical protein